MHLVSDILQRHKKDLKKTSKRRLCRLGRRVYHHYKSYFKNIDKKYLSHDDEYKLIRLLLGIGNSWMALLLFELVECLECLAAFLFGVFYILVLFVVVVSARGVVGV